MFYKRIDRYVGGRFLAYYLGSLGLMGSLYAVFDVLKRIEDLREAGIEHAAGRLAAYYGYLLPVFLVDVAPGVTLIAAGLVMVHMARRRELLTLKASGTSMHRITAPIFFWALLLSIGVFAVRETVGPAFTRNKEIIGNTLEGKVETQLLLSDQAASREVFVAEYDFAANTIKGITVMEFYPNGMLKRTVYSPRAAWGAENELVLEDAEIQEFEETGSSESEITAVPELRIQTALRRFDFVRASAERNEGGAPFQTLAGLIRQARIYPEVPYFRVTFHSRLASFFTPILLLLVGIPLLVGFEHSVDSRFLGVVVSFAVASAYYALVFVLSSLGSSDAIGPILAGWLPAILLGVLGLWLFESMLT